MLWDRGVETRSRDISERAMSEIRPDVRCWCEIGSITDPIDGQYDLVLCIDVFEHMTTKDTLAAIHNITAIAPRVLFSSSPTTSGTVNAISARPVHYWLARFAEANFAPVVDFDPTFLYPHAILFEWSDEGRDDASLTAFTEIVRQRQIFAEAREIEAANRIRLLSEVANFKQTETQSPLALRLQASDLRSNEPRMGDRRTRSGKSGAVSRPRRSTSRPERLSYVVPGMLFGGSPGCRCRVNGGDDAPGGRWWRKSRRPICLTLRSISRTIRMSRRAVLTPRFISLTAAGRKVVSPVPVLIPHFI